MNCDSLTQHQLTRRRLILNMRALRPLLATLTSPKCASIGPVRPSLRHVPAGIREVLRLRISIGVVRLAKLIANSTRQRVDATSPLLSASLSTGERVQIVLPPATTAATGRHHHPPAGDEAWSIEDLARRGIFRRHSAPATSSTMRSESSCACWIHTITSPSCSLAVRCRKNILVSGPTGSGKTTWTKALIREIPTEERLITIEDAKELVLDRHPNHVRLFYSKDDQGACADHAEATARVLPAHEARPDPAGRAAGRRSFRLSAQRQFRASRGRSPASMPRALNSHSSSSCCSSSKTQAGASSLARHQDSAVFVG